MHLPIQFNDSSKQNHQKPTNEISKQQKTPKNPTTLQYKPRNQTTTHDHQKITQHFPCNPQEQQGKQKNKTYKKQYKKLLFNQKRNTTINQQPGTNTLNIASLNPDFFTTNAIQQDIINQLTQQKYT